VLMMRNCFDGRPAPFDPDFGMSGGSDTHLFAELRESGHAIRWCDRAVVYEAIPTSRVDAGWLIRREYRRGQTLSRSLRRRDPRLPRLARRVVQGALQVIAGMVESAVGVLGGRHRRVSGIQRVALGAGMVSGLFDRRYDEYRTIHGT